VEEGGPLAELHLKDESQLSEARDRLFRAYVIGDRPPEPRPLIHGVIPDVVNREL
ncbi:MAG: pyrimidine-nucleoside phosphorylase, partial [candidate division NC10 bacterium]|nr:pyrimidine-nucleoside phosphorylase [candidate division NC10 bacterium]